MPVKSNNKCSIDSESTDESQGLLRLNLSGTKLDELSAYQLVQGVLQHSFIESLDLSNNIGLGQSFASTLTQILSQLRFKYTLMKINLAQTAVSAPNMIKINKLVKQNRVNTVAEASVNRLYYPNRKQVPASQQQSISHDELPMYETESAPLSIPVMSSAELTKNVSDVVSQGSNQGLFNNSSTKQVELKAMLWKEKSPPKTDFGAG